MTIRPFANRAPTSPMDEPADEVPDPDPGLEEVRTRSGSPSPVSLKVALDERRRQGDRDAEAELADRALEGVRQQDRLAAEEAPAGLQLGDEAG